ncbi:MAG: hypothetical protein PQJ58_13165 [Spirochaetales bacterium]|nr:hypothetical protein [Spirochaetales bacterium]
MKQVVLILICLTVIFSANVFADDFKVNASYGDWEISSSRLKSDADSSMAKLNIYVPQENTMVYEFNASYAGGLSDGHGGFGLHVFVDKPAKAKAWGEGDSYLLWINYDENPVDNGTPKGLSAQIYKSESNSRMELVQSVSLAAIEKLVYNNMDKKLPIKLVIDGNSGMAKVYDPFKADYAYTFPLTSDTPMKGDYVSVRTNSLSVAFSQ